MMIVSSLIAASVAATQPAPAPQALAAPAPAAEKNMACCEKMAKGEGCECCKDMAKDEPKAGSAEGHEEHAH